ncbi:MAG: hypothetical protein L0I76_03130 [Pseudonocardia sp.]|nr:hypothetical protein [Pseudonocardia sp.]
MKVLLDTSVVIALGDLDLGAIGDEPPTISAVTVGELACGLDIGDDKDSRSHSVSRGGAR